MPSASGNDADEGGEREPKPCERQYTLGDFQGREVAALFPLRDLLSCNLNWQEYVFIAEGFTVYLYEHFHLTRWLSIYWALQCSIGFYILLPVIPMRAYKLYAGEINFRLGTNLQTPMHEWLNWSDKEMKKLTRTKDRLHDCGARSSQEAPQSCRWCRAPILTWVKTATRWSNSSNRLPVTQICLNATIRV